MNKLYSILVALVVTLFASSSFAWNPPASPAPKSWISDTSHVLSDDAHARLDAKLKVINQSSANEVAALILPTLDGENIADVGDLTAKAWGVGKKDLDNGVLVVLAMKEHKSRISTGKGVEGDLPDLKANDILQSARPYLRKGDVEGALGFIFDSASSAIANHKAEAAAAAAKAANGGSSTASTATTTSSSSRNSSCDVSGVGADGGSVWLLVAGLAALGLVWYVLAKRARERRELEELERQNREERLRQRRLAQERETRRREEEARLQREKSLSTPTPVVPVPSIPRPVARQAVHVSEPPPRVSAGVAVATGVALAAAEEEARRHRAEEARRRREREEEDSRRARERAEEDRRRRQREDDERSSSSSSSSSSSFDWGGSSSGGGSDSGGFGGGDSGGGGSSSDW
jgi:uncharacterized membrane protein YgcG